MSAQGIDKADVLAALSAERVLEHFGVDYRRSGKELRFQTCPTCGPRNRADAVSVSTETGRWKCHAHGCAGDVLHLVGGFLGIEPAVAFDAVLEVAAELAGIPLKEAPAERRRWRAEIEARRAERETKRLADQVAELEVARTSARSAWSKLARASEAGLAYLRRRRVAAAAGDVRYGQRAVCIPLRDGEGGIVNVVGRFFVEEPGAPKVRGLKGCPTLGTFGDLRKAKVTTGPVVIVEGFFDFLSARVAWPEQLVLGAHGASRVPDVAYMAAPVAVGRGLLFVFHHDQAGLRFVDRATVRLLERGVASDDIEYLDTGKGDLNDSLQARAG